jgi:DNA-binding CsgD family transcriptional regulator
MGRKADFAALTDLVYEAAVDATAWPVAVAGIADALHAHATTIGIYDTTGSAPPIVAAPRTDPEWLKIFRERWSKNNIVRERNLALMPVGVPLRFDQLMEQSEWERTSFYNEFCAPQRLNLALLVNLVQNEKAISGAGFYRSWRQGAFAGEDVRLLAALGPHLRRAVALNLRLARVEMERHSSAEMLNRCDHGAILVDESARILFANVAAEAILREGDGLRVRDGRLSAATAASTRALRGMIAGNEDPADRSVVALPCSDGRKMAVQVLPLGAETAWLAQRAAAIIFFKDPKAVALPLREDIRVLFDLTRAQAALAREILRGDGVQAAADRLNITRATARTHLLEIFQKTGTRRQAELVRVILQRSLAMGAAQLTPSTRAEVSPPPNG